MQDAASGPAHQEDFGDLGIAAVRGQLGLHLEKQKAPRELTIIDYAEKPRENGTGVLPKQTTAQPVHLKRDQAPANGLS